MKEKDSFPLHTYNLVGKIYNEQLSWTNNKSITMKCFGLSNYGYGDVPLWHNWRPQFLCEKGSRTEENVQSPLTGIKAEWKERSFKCFKTIRNVIKPLAKQKGVFICISACPPLCHFWNFKGTDARTWEWIYFQALRDNMAQLVFCFKQEYNFLSETKVYGIIYLDG